MKTLKKTRKLLLAVVLPGLLLAWMTDAYVFSVYRVPGGSMIPAIGPGELIGVNKLAATPPHPLRAFGKKEIREEPGRFQLRNIRRDDILVFTTEGAPQTGRNTLVKRCVGMPGDTVSYHEGYLEVGSYRYPLSGHQLPETPDVSPPLLQFTIPSFGDTLRLTPHNRDYWEQLLRQAGVDLSFSDKGEPLLGGRISDYWISSQNWYFLLGDNMADSFDSRVFGLIPGKNVIGTAEIALWPRPFRRLK